MSLETIFALIAFSLVMSITPGPNNLMLLASGANFGWRKSIPHMLGISIGFFAMTVLTGAGLVKIFETYPVSYVVLKVLSVLFMVYFAYKIATSTPPTEQRDMAGRRPMRFYEAVLFQWINPKAIAMAVSAISAFAPQEQGLLGVSLVAMIFALVNLPSINVWLILGTQIRRVLNVPWKLRAFNLTAAALLITTLYPILTASH